MQRPLEDTMLQLSRGVVDERRLVTKLLLHYHYSCNHLFIIITVAWDNQLDFIIHSQNPFCYVLEAISSYFQSLPYSNDISIMRLLHTWRFLVSTPAVIGFVIPPEVPQPNPDSSTRPSRVLNIVNWTLWRLVRVQEISDLYMCCQLVYHRKNKQGFRKKPKGRGRWSRNLAETVGPLRPSLTPVLCISCLS